MKRDINEWFRKLQLLLAVAMALYPLHWLSAAWLGAPYVGVVWLFSVGALLAGCLALTLPGKLRPVFGVLVCMVLLAGTVFFAPSGELLLWTVQALLACVQILCDLPTASKDSRSEIPGSWISIGIMAHVAGQVALLTDWASDRPGWMLRLSFFLYVLLVMLSVNRQSLLSASGKRRSVPHSLRRRNTVLTVILFGVSLLGGLLPSAVTAVKDILLDALRWIGEKLAQLLSDVGQGEGNASQQVMEAVPQMMDEGGEMKGLPAVLETIMLYIGAAIAIVFFAWILFRLGKKLLHWARESWDLFGKYLSASTEDYVDEVSDTRDLGEAEGIARRKRRRVRYKDDPDLPPSERIRRCFQYLKHGHTDWGPGSTAREKLPGQAATIYEKARYSYGAVSSEDAKAFIDMAKDL